MNTEHQSEELETLQLIASSVGARVIIGEVPDGVLRVGKAPAGATLCKEGRSHVVYCDHLDSPHAIEQVLHELAHAAGVWSEWRCFELEAKWALRFPPEVAMAVYEMAQQAWPE